MSVCTDDRICFKRTIGITKKEQDNTCSYIQRGTKRQKKASVLIQLSGWLRTLDMVAETGLEPATSQPEKRTAAIATAL